MFARLAFVLVLLTAASASPRVATAQLSAEDSTRFTWTTVTYRSGASVYLGAGTRAGLRVGARVDVFRRDTLIAELAVEFVSSSSASCRVVKSTDAPDVGDSARFIAAAPEPTAVTRAVAGRTSTGSGRRGALHGRIGVRQFVTALSAAPNARSSQPAVDARLDGQSLGGSPLGVTVDLRAHRSRGAGAGATTRVYQAALLLDGAAGPGRLTLGRQFATALSPVGVFDGLAADYTWKHTGAGVLAGSQPDIGDFGFSSAIREYGAWFRLHNAPAERAIWSLTSGAIGSYAAGEVNREYLYLQSQYIDRVFSLFAAQELDYNRGWRAEAESTTTTPTSTFVTARVSLGPAFSLNGGFDNRRNVRLYRDFISPEVEFDDTFRQGKWGGLQLSLSGHFQASVDVRSSAGGASGQSDSWTAATSVMRLTPLGIGFRARTTEYTGSIVEGNLRSASVELQPMGRFRLEMTMGTRRDVQGATNVEPASRRWVGVDFDTGLGRSLFLTLSTYRETGPDGRLLQYYGSLSYRF